MGNLPFAGDGLNFGVRSKLLILLGRLDMKVLLILLICALLAGCRTNESPEAQVDDIQITAQIKSKLASDVGLSTVPNVSVNSTNGVVTLAGQVNSAELKAKAEAIAKTTPKVVRVVNNLQVTVKPH
jgi:hypothetical protein